MQPTAHPSVLPRGLAFQQVFATPGVPPFEEVAWELRDVEIADDRGKVLFRQENVEIPAAWSELAAKIAVAKYFYGDAAPGDDPARGGREHSVRQLIHRVTRSISDWGGRTVTLSMKRARRRSIRT